MIEKKRLKDIGWMIPQNSNGEVSWDGVHTAILMDIRDELKKLNALLHCSNFIAIPRILRDVVSNTKPRRKRKKTCNPSSSPISSKSSARTVSAPSRSTSRSASRRASSRQA